MIPESSSRQNRRAPTAAQSPLVRGASPYAPSLVRNQSLQRMSSLLWALAKRPNGTTAAELSRITSLPAPTTARLLATMADLGLAERRPDGQLWVLGYELVRLARATDPFANFAERAHTLLEELAAEMGESATVTLVRVPAVIDVIAQADAPTLLGARNWLGQTFPMHASATGKLGLALALDDEGVRRYAAAGLERLGPRTIIDPQVLVLELRRVRGQRYATTVDELEEGFAAVAVPLADESPDMLLALAISGPTSRLDTRRRRAAGDVLRRYADRLKPLL